MGTKIYESDYALLTNLSQDKILLLEWKKPSPADEYRKVFSKCMSFAAETKVHAFVSDMRHEGAIGIDNLKWLKKIVIPRAIELNVQFIALVINETLFTRIYADSIYKALEKSRIKVNFFFNEEDAFSWVKS
jgi:hypothetical protein